jgi:pyridoxal phosphate enzyme (YggS family)
MAIALDAYERLHAATAGAKARLIAVSKTKPVADIMALYEKGHRDFGENRVPELIEKHGALPKDINWHFIGHLQRNKVKYIAPFVHLIHAVDSLRLLREINKQALNNERTIPVLLQFHIAEEESKYGLTKAGAEEILKAMQTDPLPNVSIQGVMGMATFTDDLDQVRNEFRQLRTEFDQLKQAHFRDLPSFREISMGMSGDYPVALEEGSTMVRVGSMLFGAR